ncbi:hypothetical protein CDAR_299401 [Caerostris darwini]|uniref:Uncharacterized protein n=1 Tax=Caerostris darwini TaxID=1538125 RepID=A0AAV4RM49_9ARAC|nr:hypothetical protein CDAR_299401 [Caerostris darwini]
MESGINYSEMLMVQIHRSEWLNAARERCCKRTTYCCKRTTYCCKRTTYCCKRTTHGRLDARRTGSRYRLTTNRVLIMQLKSTLLDRQRRSHGVA